MMVNLPCLQGSCPNFLRTTCSYTECQLSFHSGSSPMESTTTGYSSCLLLVHYCFEFLTVLFFSGRFPAWFSLSSFSLMPLLLLHHLCGSFSRALPVRGFLSIPAGLWKLLFSRCPYAACSTSDVGRLISFIILAGS